MSFKVKPTASATPIETFTIGIADVGTNSASVERAGEKTIVKFKMEFDVDAKVMGGGVEFEMPHTTTL